MRKILTFLFAALMSASMFALDPRSGDTWDEGTKTLTVNSDLPYEAYKYQDEIQHVIINNGVTSIGVDAFRGCTGLTSVTIPNSVTSIGDEAFRGCFGLTSVTINAESLESYGNEVFYNTHANLKIYVPAGSVNTYKAAWTAYAAKIKAIPPAWVRDGDEWDDATKTLTVNSNPGYQAYFEQTEIEHVVISDAVTSIGDYAFAYCSSLSSVTIPNSVTSIGTSAFYQCSSLSSVTIPNSVTSIGGSAFSGCTGLTSMTIDATTPPSLGENAFKYVDVPACKLYVPASSASDYKAASTWKNFYFHANPTAHEDPQNTGTYYSTFYDSDDIYLLPTGVEAYVATLSGSNLLLTKIAEAGEYIPNNCAVILKSTVESYDLFISKETPVTFSATNNLQGTDDAISAPSNCYVLSGHSSDNSVQGVGFYQFTGTLTAHKAYVVFSGSNAPRRMRFVYDQATGVENVQGDKVQSTKVLRDGQLIIIKNGVMYNTQGQMVK